MRLPHGFNLRPKAAEEYHKAGRKPTEGICADVRPDGAILFGGKPAAKVL